MTDSLFVPSFGNRPRNLIGREAVLQQFQLTLNSPPGSRDRAILLLGQRGSGKTVLLWELADLAKALCRRRLQYRASPHWHWLGSARLAR